MEHRETFYEKYIKRSFDFCGALVAILLLAIPMLIVAVLVKINLGSPVLYSATRIGKGEKPFKMYKFRSMTYECDENGKLLPDAQRMTKFGNFLRATSTDELPELFAILKGDMAFIGPRPLPVEYAPYFSQEEALRHAVRGGMSGLAQVNGRTSITWDDKFAYDVQYVRNMSFKQDWVKKSALLLPAAWSARIAKYVFGEKNSSAAESVKIGRERIELLKEYKIIP